MKRAVSLLAIVIIALLVGRTDSSVVCAGEKTSNRTENVETGGGSVSTENVKTFTGETNFLPLQRWCVVNQHDGVVPGAIKGRKGFHFLAKSTFTDQAGGDCAWTKWKPGTDVWDVSFRLEIAEKTGGKVPGVWVGMSTAPPGRMDKNDTTTLVRVGTDGVYAEVVRGEVYELDEGDSEALSFRHRTLLQSGKGRKNLGELKSGMTRIVRVRRHGDAFQLAIYNAGAKRGTPALKTVRWNVPEKMGEFNPSCLIIKRIPQRGKPRRDAERVLRGAITNITARLKPPRLRDLMLGMGLLDEGTQVTLHANLLTQKSRAYVGGEKAKITATDEDDRWQITLPKLKTGTHDFVVEQPNGLWTLMPDAIPVGRLLRSAEPIEASVEGGDSVTLHGGGFGSKTTVYFGRKEAEVIDVRDSGTMIVKAPAGREGTISIHCKAEETEYEGEVHFGRVDHPYIFFDARELAKLREACKKPPMRPHFDALLNRAHRRGDSDDNGKNESDLTNNAKVLAWAYALTGEAKYGDRLKQWMREKWDDRNVSGHGLGGAGMMAFSYDLMFEDLSKKERIKMQDYLVAVLDEYIAGTKSHRWFLTNPSNTNPVGNFGGGLCALALMHSDPRTEYVLDFARHWCLDYASRGLGPDGSCVEGRLYWTYGFRQYLLFADALRNVTGDSTLLDHPHVENSRGFVRAMIGGHEEQFLMWNDCFPRVADPAICALLGSHYGQEFMAKMADRYPGRLAKSGFGLLWRSRYEDSVPDGPPRIPTLAVLPDINWGVMRSDGSINPALVVGLKGNEGPTTHHKHEDGGSFVLHARGERVLVDTGYWGTDHNVVQIGGEGPHRSGSVITDTAESGDVRAAVIDSTKAFQQRAERVRRNIAMIGSKWVVILDEVQPIPAMRDKTKLRFIGGWPRSGKPEKDNGSTGPKKVNGRSFLLRHRNSTTKLIFHGAGPLEQTDAKSKFFSNCIGIDVPVDQFDHPVITVIEISDADARSRMAKVETGKRQITVSLPGSRDLTYRKTRAGWGLVLDGKPLASPPEHPYEQRSVICRKTDDSPKIDGKSADPVWKRAEVADGSISCWAWRDKPAPYPARVRLCWDEQNLYFLAKCDDATDYDDFHFLIDVTEAGEDLYRLAFPSNGKLDKRGWGARKAFDARVEWEAAVRDGTRIIEARLPWEGFRIEPPTAGTTFKLNFVRYRPEGIQKTSAQWSPTRGYMNDSTLFYGDLKLQAEK